MNINEKISAAADDAFAEIAEIRRELHRHPELAFCENKTAEIICSYLDRLGISYVKGIAKTGVVARIGTEHKKTLLIRADMDALPQEEPESAACRSENPGVMHACGHDVHMAVALGCARTLKQLEAELSCNIKLVFQPAEEDEGGAKPMLDEGVLENPHVDAAVACHIMNDLETGKIRVKSGAFMASPDDFEIVVRGKGGHGAYPHECVDPIVIAAHIITGLSSLTSRFCEAQIPKVISVCTINGGTFYNVLPDNVTMTGTVRTFDPDLRRRLPEMMEKLISSAASMFGAGYDFKYNFRYPPLINDKKITADFAAAAADILGDENVVSSQSVSMAGEDFAYFAEAVPATFFNLGGRNEALGSVMPLHSSSFVTDENAIPTGIKAICRYAAGFGAE